jgi:hypothetical protein
MTHHRHAMKRWLSIEHYNIAILQMTFDLKNVGDSQNNNNNSNNCESKQRAMVGRNTYSIAELEMNIAWRLVAQIESRIVVANNISTNRRDVMQPTLDDDDDDDDDYQLCVTWHQPIRWDRCEPTSAVR